MSSIEKYEVVAAAAIKKFRKMILDYKGPPEGLREYLLRELDKKNKNANGLLAEIIDQIL